MCVHVWECAGLPVKALIRGVVKIKDIQVEQFVSLQAVSFESKDTPTSHPPNQLPWNQETPRLHLVSAQVSG